MKTNNPFYYGGAVNNEHFCNRIDEIKDLKVDIHAGLNVLIYAPRRFGKTSFVLKTLKELEKEKVKYVFLDLMYLSTLDEFINHYFNALAQSLNKPLNKVLDFFKKIMHLRPNVSVNMDSFGNPNFSLQFSPKEREKTLEEVLNIPLHFAKNGEKIVVIFDEFQEITNFLDEAKMRSVIQHHSSYVSYLFMGSKKSLLHAMFMEKNRPFYKSVKHFVIKEIKKDSWQSFIQEKFSKTNKQIDDIYIHKIIEHTKGFPYYTQQFAYEIWNTTDSNVNDNSFAKALKIILERENDLFALEWDNLTLNQKRALKVVLEKEGASLYDEQYFAKYQIKASSFQVALKSLIQKDILDKGEEGYFFVDPLFEFWIKESYFKD